MSLGSSIAFGVVWFVLFTLMLGGISSAPWLPTRKRERKALADAVPVKAGQKVYDLGCGDGAMLFALADREPNARYVGYEIAVLPLVIGFFRKLFRDARYRNVSLRFGDLFGADLSDADVVFVFLLEKAYPKLREKFARELRARTTVVFEAWPLRGVPHERVIRNGNNDLPTYAYTGASIAASLRPRPAHMIGISGSWRTWDAAMEKDVRSFVRDAITQGKGVVTGGALGVDQFTTEEALSADPSCSRIVIAVPGSLAAYYAHLRAWARGHDTGDPDISIEEVERIIATIDAVAKANPQAIVDCPGVAAEDIGKEAYYERNTVVVALSDELVAFQANNSGGTQDTIDKARAIGMPVTVRSYTIPT